MMDQNEQVRGAPVCRGEHREASADEGVPGPRSQVVVVRLELAFFSNLGEYFTISSPHAPEEPLGAALGDRSRGAGCRSRPSGRTRTIPGLGDIYKSTATVSGMLRADQQWAAFSFRNKNCLERN